MVVKAERPSWHVRDLESWFVLVRALSREVPVFKEQAGSERGQSLQQAGVTCIQFDFLRRAKSQMKARQSMSRRCCTARSRRRRYSCRRADFFGATNKIAKQTRHTYVRIYSVHLPKQEIERQRRKKKKERARRRDVL